MNPQQKQNFSGFLGVFVAIIAVAFGILMWVGHEQQQKIKPVDNIALPN